MRSVFLVLSGSSGPSLAESGPAQCAPTRHALHPVLVPQPPQPLQSPTIGSSRGCSLPSPLTSLPWYSMLPLLSRSQNPQWETEHKSSLLWLPLGVWNYCSRSCHCLRKGFQCLTCLFPSSLLLSVAQKHLPWCLRNSLKLEPDVLLPGTYNSTKCPDCRALIVIGKGKC